MRNESDVKKEVKKILHKHEVWFFMPVPTGYGVQGVPDFVCCHKGYFIGIETKFGRNKLSAWQEKQQAGIESSEGKFMVINENNLLDLEEVLAAITAITALEDGRDSAN